MKTSREVAQELIKLARERAAHPAEVWGISWGFDGLDKVTGGIHTNRMHVLISRPNVGKSAIAGQLLLQVAGHFLEGDEAKVVKYFTFEMSAAKVQQRLACQIANVSIHRIETGFATQAQQEDYAQALLTLAELPILYFDTRMTISELEHEVRQPNTGWWVLDHMGQLTDIVEAHNRFEAAGLASKRLQVISQKILGGLIITHQNRSKQNAVDKRPDMESIAGSDQIAQDADLVLGLHRQDIGSYVNDDERDFPKPGELLVIKNRHGAAGFSIPMIFDPVRTLWIEKSKALTLVPKEAI